jgi:hypothetical protein
MKTPFKPNLSTPQLRTTAAVWLRDYLTTMQEQIQGKGDLLAVLGEPSLSFLSERRWSKTDAIEFARGAGYAEAVSHVLGVNVQLLTIVVLTAATEPLELSALSELASYLSSFKTVTGCREG